jgi:hypothetical protein
MGKKKHLKKGKKVEGYDADGNWVRGKVLSTNGLIDGYVNVFPEDGGESITICVSK